MHGHASKVAFLALSVAFFAPGAVRAEEGTPSEIVFREGRLAVAEGDYVTARNKFAESYRLEPTAGAALNLSLAEEKVGRFLDAHTHARASTKLLAEDDERRSLAQALLARLEHKLGRLRFVAEDHVNAEVTRDGIPVDRTQWNTVLFVEPGHHAIVIRAQQHADRRFELDIAEGATLVVPIVLGIARPALNPLQDAPRRLPEDGPTRTRAILTTWGWTTAVGAIGSGGLSLTMGALALDRKGLVDRECNATCSEEGLGASRQGRAFATVATVAGVSALLFAGASFTLFLVRPRQHDALSVGLGRVELALRF